MDAGAIQGPKVISTKEPKARAVFARLDNAGKNDFLRLRILMDDKEVVQALKVKYEWSINLIILDIKALGSCFCFMDFNYIP